MAAFYASLPRVPQTVESGGSFSFNKDDKGTVMPINH